MKNRLNSAQAKHLANSARIVGMSQFAVYGYQAWVLPRSDWMIFLGSAGFYLAAELFSLYILGSKNEQ